MTDTFSPTRSEPTLEGEHALRPEPTSIVDDPRTPEAPPSGAAYRRDETFDRNADDQLARIEDKTARIEEKYARSEAFLQRMGDKVEASTARMNDVALQSDLKAVRAEVSAISRRVSSLAGVGALVVTAIVTAILTSVIIVAVLKYGIPGVLPQ